MQTQPFFFGREQRLFGILDEPAAQKARGHGIVIAQPQGHEYVRSHRGCRQLALRLAIEGFHVLRFDFDGCGDSAGESHEASFEGWRGDLEGAITYLRGRCDMVSAIGLRLGGSLAALCDPGGPLESAVLWQPVVRGGPYLDELRAAHAEHEAEHGWSPGESDFGGLPGVAEEILGFPFAAPTLRAIEGLDLTGLERALASRVLLLDNTGAADHDELARALEPTAQVERRHVEERSFWIAEPYEMVIPVESIAAIVDWMSRAAA